MRIYTTLAGHEISYDEPSAEVEAFLRRVQSALDSPKVSSSAMLSLIHSRENPLLDRTIPELPRVTKDVMDNPIYEVLQDMLVRKDVSENDVDVEKIASRYSLSVPDAAKYLGVQPSSIRRAIQAKRLASWMKGGQYYVEPAALEALEDVGRRGPLAAHMEPLAYRVGHERDTIMRIRLPSVPEPDAKLQPVEGTIERWRRVGVLHGRAGKLRFFVLEPDSEANEITLGTFFVKGKFRVAEKIDKGTEAQKAWNTFKAL
jgi:excisionase family DNA binding protein